MMDRTILKCSGQVTARVFYVPERFSEGNPDCSFVDFCEAKDTKTKIGSRHNMHYVNIAYGKTFDMLLSRIDPLKVCF